MKVVGCAWVLERCGRPVAERRVGIQGSVIAWSLGSSSGPVSGMAGVEGMDIAGPVVVEAGSSNPGRGGVDGVGAWGWMGAGGPVIAMGMTDDE